MREYEAILPGSAERMLKMAEEQSKHRMLLESTVIPDQQRQSKRGQLFAFILAFFMIFSACYALYADAFVVAGGIFTVALIGVVGLFINGRRHIQRDLKQKED